MFFLLFFCLLVSAVRIVDSSLCVACKCQLRNRHVQCEGLEGSFFLFGGHQKYLWVRTLDLRTSQIELDQPDLSALLINFPNMVSLDLRTLTIPCSYISNDLDIASSSSTDLRIITDCVSTV